MLIPLRDLPGVDRIESAAVLGVNVDEEAQRDYRRRVRSVERSIFGLEDGASPPLPSWAYRLRLEDWTRKQRMTVARIVDQWDRHFDVLDAPLGETAAAWAALGWDVLDARGLVLRCLDDLAPAMVCAAKGLKGKTMDELRAILWGERLKASNDTGRKAQNEAFLQLGDRRGRRKAA